MSVYQGDIVQLAKTEGSVSIGWYQKLRDNSGNVCYYNLTIVEDRLRVINSKDVAESSNSYPKEFKIVKRVSGSDITQVLNLDVNKAEKVSQQADIAESIRKIDYKISKLTKVLNDKTKAYYNAMADLEDAQVIKSKVLRGEKFRYLYAIFPGDYRSKEYCWRIPDSMNHINFVPGGFVKVIDNTGSKANVIVVRIEESSEYIDHKVLCNQE